MSEFSEILAIFAQKAHLHIVVNCFFGYYSANIHHVSMKFGREVYAYKI